MEYFRFWQLQSKYRPIYPYTPVGLKTSAKLHPSGCDPDGYVYGIPQEDKDGSNYGMYDTARVFPWANDPSNILYNPDTKVYHRWGLYHSDGGLGTAWVEHIALSVNGPWEQTVLSLPKAWLNNGMEDGDEIRGSWEGGSAFIDWNGVFGYGKGTLFFIASLAGFGTYNGKSFTDQSVAFAYATPLPGKTNGLGAPVKQGQLIFSENQTNTDWRDPRIIYDSDNKQFVMAISNHGAIQFWRNNSGDIRNWIHASTFDTGFGEGIECPSLNKIKDAQTGSTVWALTCALIISGGDNPSSSVRAWVGSWDGRNFSPTKGLTSDAASKDACAKNTGAYQLEYGAECYAPATCDPYGYDGQRLDLPSVPDTLYWSTYLGNWSESVWDNPAYGYAGGTWEVRGLQVNNQVPMPFPLDTYTRVSYQHRVRLHQKQISFPVSNVTRYWTSRLTMYQHDELTQLNIVFTWSNDNCVTITWKDKGWTIERQQSGMFSYPESSNGPMPNAWANGWSDLIIHYDDSQFVFWDLINGRVASFWIFPDNLGEQYADINAVELSKVTVHPIPESTNVDYYFGIRPLSPV